MARFKNRASKDFPKGESVQFTAQEETDRDAEEIVNTLDATRASKIEVITNEGVSRIALQVPEWDDLETIRLIKSFINLMDFSLATAEQILAKDIHDFARTRIVFARTATQTELDAYDPVTDPNWPV